MTLPLEGRVVFGLTLKNYEDWPYKVIYASDGISGETLLSHINAYYLHHSDIPIFRRPNLIHVSGKYVIFRVIQGMSVWDINTHENKKLEEGTFHLFTTDSDIQGIVWLLDGLQQRATASTYILYKYGEIINRVNNIPTSKTFLQNS